MSATSSETILNALQWRYATKKFDPTRKISTADFATLQESLRLAPSSFGLQPFQFIVVQSPSIRKQLTSASWNQPQIENCSHLVVFTHLKQVSQEYINQYAQEICATRGLTADQIEPYRQQMSGFLANVPAPQQMVWTSRQAYIAMGMLMQTAALLHIDACPMEGIDAAAYNQILNLENSAYTTVAVVTLGYRAADDTFANMKKVRKPSAALITHLE